MQGSWEFGHHGHSWVSCHTQEHQEGLTVPKAPEPRRQALPSSLVQMRMRSGAMDQSLSKKLAVAEFLQVGAMVLALSVSACSCTL